MEDLVILPGFWRGRRVLLTGHTGFKGAWMSLLLRRLGADVYGFALPPLTERDLFTIARVESDIHHTVGDVTDLTAVRRAFDNARPEIVIHMAAQALVRSSYEDPVGTYATNVMGTVHVLDCIRLNPEIKACVIVTSDKCYDNTGQIWGYRENERYGGHDPYSNSKGCTELVIDAYRRSYFKGKSRSMIASARAGNVIGGGDWAQDRIVPDAIRAFLSNEPLMLRNPHAIRPWQYVLDPIVAYLMLAERLVSDGASYAEGWNFGPAVESEISVGQIADMMAKAWGGDANWLLDSNNQLHESSFLKLDSAKARSRLGWRPLLNFEQALNLTIEWYKAFEKNDTDMRSFTLRQIENVMDLAPASTETTS